MSCQARTELGYPCPGDGRYRQDGQWVCWWHIRKVDELERNPADVSLRREGVSGRDGPDNRRDKDKPTLRPLPSEGVPTNMTEWRDIAKEQLIRHEGNKPFPYVDSVGKISIGIGRNLTDQGLSQMEIDDLFTHDLHDAEDVARMLLTDSIFDGLTDTRRAVIVNMAFNLGYKRLAKFSQMLLAVKTGDYRKAAAAMMDSQWARQVGGRAQELSRLMEAG